MADVAMEMTLPLTFLDRADDEREDADMAEIEDAADELFEFVCQLSAACKANCNVLVDGALVDQLEAAGKEILRARGRENAPSVMSMMAALPRRMSMSAADDDDDMNMMMEAASRYEVLPSNGYYASKEDVAPPSPTQGYSPRLEGFKLDNAKPETDLAASLASTYSTASMAHYDDASDDEEYDEESVMTMSHLSLGMSLGLGDRKYSTFSNTSEGSASRVLPYDIDPADEMFVQSLQDQVDSLLLENCQIVAENARLAEMSEMTAAEVEFLASKKQSAEELLRTQSQRLMCVEQALEETRGQHVSASEKIREEMRAEFEAELATRTQELQSLQSELASKNSEIAQLSHNVDNISAAIDETSQEGEAGAESLISTLRQNNVVKETEILEMQETLLQKDREICSLYMHLSTKKKLIDEITRSFVKNMEEANEAKVPTSDVRFDLDTCLFKSVVDKEKRLDQLTAALSAMEQEVEDLETRIADKEREKHTLNCNQQLLARTLCAMKSQLSQVQGEKVQLDAALNESQARIAALMESLEQKEKQIREFGRLSLPQGATILGC